MAIIPIQNRYTDRAGYTVLNTDTNQLEVFSDGSFKPIEVSYIQSNTLANWQASNPVLALGEAGYIIDTNEFVIGDGQTTFNNLKRFLNESQIATTSRNGFMSSNDKSNLETTSTNLNNHIGSTDGHPTATTTSNGFMTALDKQKLDNMSVTENNEYFNIYKNSKLLYESTTNFDVGPLITDISTMKQYLVVRRSTQHGIAPTQLVKIDLTTKEETILLDGISSNIDYAHLFPLYHNNTPYLFLRAEGTDGSNEGITIINGLTGDIIKQDISITVRAQSYITINNDIYFIGDQVPLADHFHHIIKYSFDSNTFTILNTYQTTAQETEEALGKINGKFFAISRTTRVPNRYFNLFLFNDDWSIKTSIPLDLGHDVFLTTPYIFRKGSKLLFTFISRHGSVETPGNLFTYEITEKDDNFTFELKNIFSAVLPEDVYYTSMSDYITVTGYQIPTILPFSKTGNIIVEDRRTTRTYITRLYQLYYDNDISVDYTNF